MICDAEGAKFMLCATSDCDDLLCKELAKRPFGCYDESSVPVALRCGPEPTPEPEEPYVRGFVGHGCHGEYISSIIGSKDCVRGPGVSVKIGCRGDTYQLELFNNLECHGSAARRWTERQGCANIPFIAGSLSLPDCKKFNNQTKITVK